MAACSGKRERKGISAPLPLPSSAPTSKCPRRARPRMAPPKPDEKAYTMKEALKEAADLLNAQFGSVDQEAAVTLAVFLHGAHAKEQFIKARAQPDERAFM